MDRRQLFRGALAGVALASTHHPAFRTLLSTDHYVRPCHPDTAPMPVPADTTLTGEVSLPGFEIPAGQVWVFDPNQSTTVTVNANVVVRGRLEMKPARPDVVHTLVFTGIDERRFVGGGMAILDSDVGLWVTDDGQLDLQGTPRAAWNRTGSDPTWLEGDELRVAPQAINDFATFAPFVAGSSVPSVIDPGGGVHYSEVVNLTRNVRIHGGGIHAPEILNDRGRAHISFLHAGQPQTMRNVELRWLGPRGPHPRDNTDGVAGRYPLHFHHCGDGSRGSLIESVVVRESGNRAFVPHASHGVEFYDCVAFDVYESPYWWDPSTRTDRSNDSNDTIWDHCAAMLVSDFPNHRGYDLRGFSLGSGTGNVIRNSAAVGIMGKRVNAGAFHWPSASNAEPNVWEFAGNVAHNNRAPGISVWQNDASPHVIRESVSYRNAGGISHGAYLNQYTYRDCLTFDETVVIHSVGPSTFERLRIGGNIHLANHSLASSEATRFIDLDLQGGITIDEAPNGGGKKGVFHFLSTEPRFDLSPDRFTVVSILSEVRVVNSDGSSFEIA